MKSPEGFGITKKKKKKNLISERKSSNDRRTSKDKFIWNFTLIKSLRGCRDYNYDQKIKIIILQKSL